ncbi:MAG TPA: hypothetical protein VF288_10605 [Mycobacteriales bacterium]
MTELRDVDLSQYRLLRLWARTHADSQASRIRASNRALHAPVVPEIFAAEIDAAHAAEHRLMLALRRQYRKTAPPGVIEWQKESPGIGTDMLAQLLGELGHPRYATPMHWEGTGNDRVLVVDEPFERTVGQLWQYCGHGRPGRVTKGATAAELFALGNPRLKVLTHLMAECSIKEPGTTTPGPASEGPEPDVIPPGRDPFGTSQVPAGTHGASARVDPLAGDHPGSDTHATAVASDPLRVTQACNDAQRGNGDADPSTTRASVVPAPTRATPVWPYRVVYEDRRRQTLGRVHAERCARCGPSGHPAAPGSAWSRAHQHADALRVTGKAILHDLWLAAEEP